MRRVPVKETQRYFKELAEYLKAQKADLLKQIREKKELTKEIEADVQKALAEFKGVFQSDVAQD